MSYVLGIVCSTIFLLVVAYSEHSISASTDIISVSPGPEANTTTTIASNSANKSAISTFLPSSNCERCTEQGRVMYRYQMWGSDSWDETGVCMHPRSLLKTGAIITARASWPRECSEFTTNYNFSNLVFSSRKQQRGDEDVDCILVLKFIFRQLDLLWSEEPTLASVATQEDFVYNAKWLCDNSQDFTQFFQRLLWRRYWYPELRRLFSLRTIFEVAIQALIIVGKPATFSFISGKLTHFFLVFVAGLYLIAISFTCRSYIKKYLAVGLTLAYTRIASCAQGKKKEESQHEIGPDSFVVYPPSTKTSTNSNLQTKKTVRFKDGAAEEIV
jgi:hypothetical protein